MGRAARWFLGLLGGKKSTNGASPAENRPVKEKKRWGFVKSFREKEKPQQQKHCPPSEQIKGSYREERMGSLLSEGDEQGKRAVAVAAATAVAAEAAVAAAQAAAAVVRLTSSGRSVGLSGGGVKREELAAIKIQAAFRGYLARRALRALKGLVKLQALVRGNIVRKQAAETLRCMQALVRVQARARTCRALLSETSRSSKSSRSNPGPPTPEKYESTMRSNASKTNRSGSLKRNSSKKTRMDAAAHKDGNYSEHWNWLDQWMEERYWDGREVSKTADDEKNAKILEVDTGKPTKFNSKHKTNNLLSSSSPMNSDQNSRSLAAAPDSPSKDSTTAQLSISSPSSSVDMRHSASPLRFLIVEPEDLGGSPQFFSATSLAGSSRRVALTPAKSDYSRSLFSGYSDHPNYMANTESSRAKARSQSAPKQRPEFEKLSSIKRLSGQGLGGHKSSLHAKFVNKAYPGSGRLDRLGMPIRM